MDILNSKIMRPLLNIMLIFLLTMCKPYENLILPKKDFIGINLKIDGYFYNLTDKKSSNHGNLYDCFILYQNGIYYNLVSVAYDKNLKMLDKYILLDYEIGKKVEREKEYINTQIGWGVFNVKGSEIKVERWLSGNGGTYPTQMLIGRIKNDTTIHFHTQIGDNATSKGKKKTYKIDETYHFRQFSPKPDSTNNFIN